MTAKNGFLREKNDEKKHTFHSAETPFFVVRQFEGKKLCRNVRFSILFGDGSDDDNDLFMSARS